LEFEELNSAKRLDSSGVASILDSMETDLDKAREIVRKHVRFIGRMGMMHENIAMAVAEGIALGRKEGIAMAAEAIVQLKGNPSPMAAEHRDVDNRPDSQRKQ
jgi:hypothetical protein